MKNKRLWVGLLIFIALVGMVWGAYRLWPQHPPQEHTKPVLTETTQDNQIRIYFSRLNKGNEVTEPVNRNLATAGNSAPQTVVKDAVTQLLKGPTASEKKAGYFSEIPAGTKLLSISTNAKGIIINLSSAFGDGGGSNSMTQRVAELAKTLLSLPQKRPVYLQMEGQSVEVLGGEGVMIHEPITEDPSVTQ